DFGTYDQGSADLTAMVAGTIDVQCPDTLVYMVGIDDGILSAGRLAGGPRRLVEPGSGNFIEYTPKVLGAPLGDAGLGAASGGTYTETNTDSGYLEIGNGIFQQIPITIDTTGLSTAGPGTYSDTIVVSVVW
ncbi:MAG: spore coat protein U domain-containing protein, partial [Gammaproteobacteria bacterium]